MSAHRRPEPRGRTTPGRATTAGSADADAASRLGGCRRRRAPAPLRLYRLVPVALGLAVLGIGAVVGPGVVGPGWSPDGTGGGRDRITLAALPADAPDQGLVYDGLAAAGAGSLCAGSYALDDETCTHGPDRAPAGLRVRRDVGPVTGSAPEPVTPRRERAQVPPDAAIVRDEGGSAITPDAPALVPDAAPGEADFVLGNHDVACTGDGRTGKRVQVLYLHEFGAPSRFTDFLGSMRVWSAGADRIFDASAAETGGSRHIRFVTTPQCQVDVSEVQLPPRSLTSFRASIGALRTLGYNRTDRKYLMFADANVYCGIGTYVADPRPGLGNRNNGGPSYGRVDAGCWSSAVAAREITRMLGALLRDSPNSTGAGGCSDDHDLLCGRDRSGTPVRTVCPKKHENRLDCGHDDYFSTNPRPGSYLARHWNVAQSDFLLRTDGADPPGVPEPTRAVPAAPPTRSAPPPSAAPSRPQPSVSGPAPRDSPRTPAPAGPGAPRPGDLPPGAPRPGDLPPREPRPGDRTSGQPRPGDPTSGGTRDRATGTRTAPPSATAKPKPKPPVAPPTSSVGAVLEIRDATSTSVRLTWSAASPAARYQVSVDGAPVAATNATRARLIGLRPDARYRVTVRNAATGYTARGTAQTAPAARPAQNSWFVLTNSLTGGAADLYAARSTNGTPLVLSGADGDAQQQWKLVPAGGGRYSLRSRATGRCVLPLGGNPVAGAPLVQGDCASDARQSWSLQASDHGFTLRTSVGDLVAGVGAQRFGASRLLVLQSRAGVRHQSWTAVPG